MMLPTEETLRTTPANCGTPSRCTIATALTLSAMSPARAGEGADGRDRGSGDSGEYDEQECGHVKLGSEHQETDRGEMDDAEVAEQAPLPAGTRARNPPMAMFAWCRGFSTSM
ncbi:hypothetical protein ACEXQE_01765 [Herbiconiux sp. P17]|uniref:hypothetical protein n=1 Tax=Herbiconiux wuyangfengii TaxID=3342794 RepID=UPI0035B7CB2E